MASGDRGKKYVRYGLFTDIMVKEKKVFFLGGVYGDEEFKRIGDKRKDDHIGGAGGAAFPYHMYCSQQFRGEEVYQFRDLGEDE
jgi:hypothetical protein